MNIPSVKESFGERNPALLPAFTSRSSLRRLQGRAVEAVEDLENTVNTLGTIYGDAHQTTLITSALLGQIYRHIGREKEGKERNRNAWETMKKTLGGRKHPRIREVQGML